MDDIDYHSIYTQFLTECDKNVRPPAIITKGFLGKTTTPNTKVNVFYILPQTVTEAVVKSIIHNSSHPVISKFKVIKRKEQTIDRQLRIETIDYNASNGIMFSDILRFVDTSCINIVLCDTILLDYTTFDYIHHVSPQTLAVISSRKFKSGIPNDINKYYESSNYLYEIDNINGFIFYGRPDIDVPYYSHFYGARHMLIKKFYAMKYNIVNVSKLIPCYLVDHNADYFRKDNTYLTNASFSVMLIQPQSSDEIINVLIDEKDIFKHRDTKPIDTTITFTNIQTDLETVFPLTRRIGISELEHAIKINLFQMYQREFDRRQKIMVENHERQIREINAKIEEERDKREEEIQKQLKQKTDELHDKYEKLEKDFEAGFGAIKSERLKEIEKQVEEEYEVLRAKRLVSIDMESQTLFQALDVQYNELMKQRKEKLDKYESTERDRIDTEIRTHYSDKYDEITKRMELRRIQLEEEIEKHKEDIINKTKEEIRSEYILKYNDEYATAITQLNKMIEYRRNAAFVNIEKELEGFKEKKIKELDAWEKVRQASVDVSLRDYEVRQRENINQTCDKYQKSRMADINLFVEHQYTIDCEENKRKLEEEYQKVHMNTLREANETIAKLIESRTTALNAELELIRNEKMTNIHCEIDAERERAIQNMKIEIDQQRASMISSVELEASELAAKLAKDREETVSQILESSIALKEAEINAAFAIKQTEAEHKILEKIREAEQEASAKILQIQKEFEAIKHAEDERIKSYEKTIRDKLSIAESRIKDEIISQRSLVIERELANKRSEMNKKLQTDFETKQKELSAYINNLKEAESQNMKSEIDSKKIAKERELSLWLESEKQKLSVKLREESGNIEKTLKELYDLKKFEFAEIFTKEVSEIEKSRISFHNREIERINKEIADLKQTNINAMMADVSKHIEKYKSDRIEELNKTLNDELSKLREHRIKELSEEIQKQAIMAANKELGDVRKKLTFELEAEISTKRKEEFEKAIAEARSIASTKVEDEMKEFKTMRMKQIDAEIQETERRRRAKIREMQEMVNKMS